MSVVTKLFGTHSENEIKRLKPTLDKINSLRPTMMAYTDDELRGKTEEYKKRYQDAGRAAAGSLRNDAGSDAALY